MPASLQGKKSPLLRGLLRSAAPGVAVSLACAPSPAADVDKPGKFLAERGSKAKPAPSIPAAQPFSPKEDAERERDRLKPLQEITAGPPPLAPSVFSPEPDKRFLPFPASLLFPPIEETLELRLFAESEIPWNKIAFATVRNTLTHYFDDRRKGSFPFHMGTIEPVRP